MKEKLLLRSSLFLLAGVVGCGDSPKTVLRDTLTTWNELAVTDEAAADTAVKDKLGALKKKWEEVKKRVDGFSKYTRIRKPIWSQRWNTTRRKPRPRFNGWSRRPTA